MSFRGNRSVRFIDEPSPPPHHQSALSLDMSPPSPSVPIYSSSASPTDETITASGNGVSPQDLRYDAQSPLSDTSSGSNSSYGLNAAAGYGANYYDATQARHTAYNAYPAAAAAVDPLAGAFYDGNSLGIIPPPPPPPKALSLPAVGPPFPGLFPHDWDVRSGGLHNFPDHAHLDTVAFDTSEVTCTLRFVSPFDPKGDLKFDVTVDGRGDGKPLKVRDVLEAVIEALYKSRGAGFIAPKPRHVYEQADAARRFRLGRAPSDGSWLRIDLWSKGPQYLQGLRFERVDQSGWNRYVVVLGNAPPSSLDCIRAQ